MIPVDVLDAVVDPVAIAVYLRIRQHADSTGEGAYPSRKRLATQLDFITPKPVDKAIAKLVKLGLIDVFERWRDADGNIAFARDERFNRQTSNGFIVYDEPGAGSGAESVAAPPEVLGGVHLQRPPENVDGVPERRPPGYPYGDPPGPTTGTLTISNELNPPDPVAREVTNLRAEPSREAGEGNAPPDATASPGDRFAAGAQLLYDFEAERGRELPRSFRTGLQREAARALKAGVQSGLVRAALQQWDDGTSRSAGRLPYLIEEQVTQAAARSQSVQESRAEAAATERVLREMRRKPTAVADPSEYLKRALSPEAWERREARRAEQEPP